MNKYRGTINNNHSETSPLILSKEINQILLSKPSWVIRNGIYLLLLLTGFVISTAYFIRFPEMLQTPAGIIFVSVNELTALVEMKKPGNEKITPGQKITLIETATGQNVNGIIKSKTANIHDSVYQLTVTFSPGGKKMISTGASCQANIIVKEQRLLAKIF